MVNDVDRLLPYIAPQFFADLSRDPHMEAESEHVTTEYYLKLRLLAGAINAYHHLYSKLWDVREVAFTKLFPVDMIIDIDGFSPHITPQFLHEVSGHTAPD